MKKAFAIASLWAAVCTVSIFAEENTTPSAEETEAASSTPEAELPRAVTGESVTVTEEPAAKKEEAKPEIALEAPKMSCPFANEVRNECSKETAEAFKLFGEGVSLDPIRKSYSEEDRCKIWWWTQAVSNHPYAPLAEWANYAEDALMEAIDPHELYKSIGLAPAPPAMKLNSKERPVAQCVFGRPKDADRLSRRLRHLDLRDVSPDALSDLISHCLAFELETAVWKRITTKVVGTYVIPIGPVNVVVLGRPRFLSRSLTAREENPQSGQSTIVYTAVGACPVSKDPRHCVETFFKNGQLNFEYGFPQGKTFESFALAQKREFDSLYGSEYDKPVPVTLSLDPEGKIYFFYRRKTDKKLTTLDLQVDEKGLISLGTPETVCEISQEQGTQLTLKPIAFGDRLQKLQRQLAMYSPSDFPASGWVEETGVERGCATRKSYSVWAADTANAIKHFSHHGWPIDTLYRTIAYQRYKWDLGRMGVASARNDLVYGAWRKRSEETPIFVTSPYARQAKQFALGDSDRNRGIALRNIHIDGKPATEVWYYQKSVTVYAGTPEEKRANIVLVHLDGFEDVYANSVIAKLVNLSGTCSPLKDQKLAFLEAMYALFNASPLQKGNEIAAKVFMAAMYQNLFGTKLEAMSKFYEADIDAFTMTFGEFREKYLRWL